MKKHIFILSIIFLCFHQHAIADASIALCESEIEENKADALLDTLYESWENIYQYYDRYSKFDCFSEGYFGEGLADAVVKRLANNWGSLNELAKLTRKNKKFEKFIILKINATTSEDDLMKIHYLANKQCSKNLAKFCKKIDHRALDAYKEIMEY